MVPRKEYAAEWYQQNKAKRAAKDRAWLERNRDRRRATTKAWKVSNPDKVKAARRRRYQRERIKGDNKRRSDRRKEMCKAWPGFLQGAVGKGKYERSALRGQWVTTTSAMLEANPYCPVSGCLMVPGQGKFRGTAYPNSPSLDRIDPRKGYTPDNVRVVCQFVNLAKNAMPDHLFRAWILATADHIRSLPDYSEKPLASVH